MFLPAAHIADAVARQDLVIDPFDPSLLKPASYVLRLGSRFSTWQGGLPAIDVWSPAAGREGLHGPHTEESITIDRTSLVLAATRERVSLSFGLVGFLFSLSHLTRLGLLLNVSSQLISPGLGLDRPTALTIELASLNPSPVRLRAGTPICHLVLAQVGEGGKPPALADSVFAGVPSPSPPMLYEEFAPLISVDE